MKTTGGLERAGEQRDVKLYTRFEGGTDTARKGEIQTERDKNKGWHATGYQKETSGATHKGVAYVARQP